MRGQMELVLPRGEFVHLLYEFLLAINMKEEGYPPRDIERAVSVEVRKA